MVKWYYFYLKRRISILTESELFYQTRSLLGRLIDFYVNTKKTQIIKKLENANDSDENELLKEVNELQQLKNSGTNTF